MTQAQKYRIFSNLMFLTRKIDFTARVTYRGMRWWPIGCVSDEYEEAIRLMNVDTSEVEEVHVEDLEDSVLQMWCAQFLASVQF
jgi:hypothetical protein